MRLLKNLVGGINERPTEIKRGDLQFILGGFSWRSGRFRIWTFDFDVKIKRFCVSESGNSWNPRLGTVAFIGDWAAKFRRRLALELRVPEIGAPANSEPLRVLSSLLKEKNHTIGGSPQLIRIGPHMNGREFCVRWHGKRHLYGRGLLPYENCDFWVVDPDTGRIEAPSRKQLEIDVLGTL